MTHHIFRAAKLGILANSICSFFLSSSIHVPFVEQKDLEVVLLPEAAEKLMEMFVYLWYSSGNPHREVKHFGSVAANVARVKLQFSLQVPFFDPLHEELFSVNKRDI